MSLAPALFALTAAALFGVTVHTQNQGLDDTDGLTGTFIGVCAMAALMWLLSPFFLQWRWWGTHAAFLFALSGLVFPALSSRMQIAAVRVVGPAITSAIGSFTPLFAVLPAVVLLGEPFGWQAAAGLMLMVGGLTASAVVRRGIPRGWPVAALLMPLGAAFMRGIVQPVTKAGYAELPSPLFATLVMATVSVLVLGVLVWGSGRMGQLRRPRRGHAWFAAGGVAIGLGILSLNTAIGAGDIVVAAPLASTTPLWALLYGAVLFRRERLGLRHAVVAVLVAAGAVLVVTR